MKKQIIFFLLLSSSFAYAQLNLNNISMGRADFVTYQNNQFKLNENSEFKQMEAKFTFGNLRIYMLKANETFLKPNRGIGNYTSLQDAIRLKKIVITELAGGSVNTLEVQNISKDTIMILAGEIVTGGKQDRVIGQDIIIPPKSKKLQVSVFCVEHGRWSQNGSGNQFDGYYGVSSNAVRKKAVVEKDQSAVWDKVADMNKKNKTETSTGTYTQLHTSEVLSKELPKYKAHFESLMASDSGYIGFVAVTGDTIISCDLFATNRLFKKSAPMLLKSVAVEAITNGAKVTIAAATVLKFLSEFMKDETTQEETVKSNGTMLMQNGKKIHLNYYKK